MRLVRAFLSLFGAGLVVATAATMAVVATALPASAHDPIFVDDAQTTPETGPYMPDGTISWALYGRVLEAGDTRGFEFDLEAGDELFVSLLIPNLEPELSLSDAELPTLEVTTPSGEKREFVPDMREIFDEPFSKTSYVTLLEGREPAEAGRYQALVVGHAPARFSAVIGENEVFFTESERSGDRPTSFPEISAPLQAWYTTPAGEDAPTGAGAEGDAGEIQMDLIDDADVATDDGAATKATAAEEGDAATAAEESAETTATEESADTKPTPTESAETASSDEAAAESSETSGGSSLAWIIAPIAIVVMAGLVYFVTHRSPKTDQ